MDLTDRNRNRNSETCSERQLVMSSSQDNKALTVSVIVGLLVVVNIIITAILVGRPVTTNNDAMPQNKADSGAKGPVINVGSPGAGINTAADSGSRLYLVAYGHDFGPYEYIDAEGYHKGFSRELLSEVCTAAGVKCMAVFDKYTNCWDGKPGVHPYLGTGLQAHYYDGCIGWVPTVERIHAASFTMPFTTAIYSYFYYKKGKTFSTSDFNGKTIGFIDGFASNEKCVARSLKDNTGIPLTKDQIVYARDSQVLEEMINNETIDAAFMSAKAVIGSDTVETLKAEPVECTLGGLSVMSRADSEFPDIWNRGFQTILTNGQYQTLCDEAKDDHSERGQIECVQSFNWNV